MPTEIEINKEVSEKIMRIYFTWPDDRCLVCGWIYASSTKDGCVPGNCSLRPQPKVDAFDRRITPYATDAACMMRVIETMYTRGFDFNCDTVSPLEDPMRKYHVWFTPNGWADDEKVTEARRKFSAQEYTMSMAVALSALKAVKEIK